MDRRIACLALSSLLLLAGCGTTKFAVPRDLDNVEAMRSVLGEQIPPGTSLIEAEKIMTQNNFVCEWKRAGKYSCQEFTREGFDFLFCKRTDKVSSHEVRCWQIALVVEDALVRDAYVDISYTGP